MESGNRGWRDTKKRGKKWEGLGKELSPPTFLVMSALPFLSQAQCQLLHFPSDLHRDVHCFIIIRYQLCLIDEADTWQLKIEMISQTRKNN